MFPASYFAPRYFAPRYFPKVGAAAGPAFDILIEGEAFIVRLIEDEAFIVRTIEDEAFAG